MIRQANMEDFKTLVDFNIALAYETEKLSLKQELVEQGVLAVLNDSSKGVYYVYEEKKKVIGQLLITYEWSDWRNANWWWIQSVYTIKTHRKQGIFTALFKFIETMVLLRSDACGIRLGVDRDNLLAQKTYKRLNMDESNYYLYELPK